MRGAEEALGGGSRDRGGRAGGLAVLQRGEDAAAAVVEDDDGEVRAGLGRPEDVAAAVLYLVSDEAGWVTGATLHVNGGMAML